MNRLFLCFVVASAASLSLPASRVAACSPAFCPFRSPLPAGTEEAPAHLPANGVTIATFAGVGSTVEVERVRDGISSVITIDDPTAPLVTLVDEVAAGDLLRVTATHVCSESPSTPLVGTTVIEITAAAALPSALGTVETSVTRGPVDVFDNRGSCTSPIDSARIDYALAADASIAPWADALELVTYVDDTLTGQGPDGLLFHACEPPLPSQSLYDSAAGAHRIRMEARIRGMDVTLTTAEASAVLDCSAVPSATCSVSIAPRASAACWLPALGLLALVHARRRRRNRP